MRRAKFGCMGPRALEEAYRGKQEVGWAVPRSLPAAVGAPQAPGTPYALAVVSLWVLGQRGPIGLGTDWGHWPLPHPRARSPGPWSDAATQAMAEPVGPVLASAPPVCRRQVRSHPPPPCPEPHGPQL